MIRRTLPILSIPMLVLGCTCLAALVVGCNSKKGNDDSRDRSMGGSSSTMHMQEGGAQKAMATIKPSKAAATQPSNQNVTGEVNFTQQGDDVHVVADLNGLSPGKHGIHIHQKADLSDPQLQSAGPHYNPTHAHHGGPDSAQRHTGDLGNITADDSGHAHLDMTLENVKLQSLAGKSVIVHAGEDDLKTDPAGNSGGRIAGGAITIQD